MTNAQEQIKNFFDSLSFDEESHTYSLEGRKLKTSVSGLVKKFVKRVDFFNIAKRIDDSKRLPKGTMKRIWKLNADFACAAGDKAHYFGEVYAFHRNIQPTDKLEEAIVAFWKSLPDHIVPAFTELTMYHKEYMFGGMADIILYNKKTGKFIIADYKTNKELFKNFNGKRLKLPFTKYLENNFNKYQLQFSFYQILFEQTGFEIEQRLLIWLKRDGTFEMYDTEDLTEELKIYMENEFK